MQAAAAAAPSGEQQQRRVVVTGMGVVTPLGHEVDTFYDNLLEGRSGISLIEGFDTSERWGGRAGPAQAGGAGRAGACRRRQGRCLQMAQLDS